MKTQVFLALFTYVFPNTFLQAHEGGAALRNGDWSQFGHRPRYSARPH